MKMLNDSRLAGYLVAGTVLGIVLACGVYLVAIGADPVNPRAEFWRLVRDGTPGYTAVSSKGHHVLIQTDGEIWREFRNVILVVVTPWLMGAVLALILVFHRLTGGEKLPGPKSGIRLHRFSLWERLLHWYVAVLFIVLAVTGLSLLLGRVALLPLAGHGFLSAYLSAAKVVHNWSGPFFLVGVVIMFFVWLPQNHFRRIDLTWFKSMGGMVGSGPHPHSEKVNGGEKAWFWLIAIFGVAIGASGLLLDFPIWGQSRLTMTIALVVHAVVGVLFIVASFGHIYMGTAGSQGAFEGMWTGKVDAVWARQHCDLWYEKMMEKDGPQPRPAEQG